jgi:hypothetical protein
MKDYKEVNYYINNNKMKHDINPKTKGLIDKARKLTELTAEMDANRMKYMIATIDGKTVFLHEAEWVLGNKKPIPKGMLVFHSDGNTVNNAIPNLDLVDENSSYGDLHRDTNKVFHSQNIERNKEYIRVHFQDIYKMFVENSVFE